MQDTKSWNKWKMIQKIQNTKVVLCCICDPGNPNHEPFLLLPGGVDALILI